MNDIFNSGFPPGLDGQMGGLNQQGIPQQGFNQGYGGYGAGGYDTGGYGAGGYDTGGYGVGSYGAGGYYNNAPQGRVDGLGFVHYTKAQYLEGLRCYVTNLTRVAITKEEKLDDMPQFLRHACAAAKISKLAQCYFQVPETGMCIPFFFCLACGKLYYPRDFM